MSYSNAKRRRIKPFARPTSFDINVAYDIRHYQRIKYGNVIDPYFPAVGTDEAFKVLEGEVLMQTNSPDVVVMVIIKCMFFHLPMDLKPVVQP